MPGPACARPLVVAALVALLGPLTVVGDAAARPPPPPDDYYRDPPQLAVEEPVTLVEWTSWLRLGLVVRDHEAPASARAVRLATVGRFDGAAGAGFTLPLGRRARLGAWAEFRDWGLPVLGGELALGGSPRKLDLFFYEGDGVLTVRAGGNPDVLTAQLGWGYQAPWDLFGAKPRRSRYMIGVRAVATVTQSRLDRRDWVAAVGLELEPVGALRYLLGVRSWY